MDLATALSATFCNLSDLIRMHAAQCPDATAMVDDEYRWNWREFDALIDRVAASLQRDGVRRGSVVALLGRNSAPYAAIYLAVLRVGAVAAPLATSTTADSTAAMIADCAACLLFIDPGLIAALESVPGVASVSRVPIDYGRPGSALKSWLAQQNALPEPVPISPDDAFNVIYSSGTTGVPKGIVQSHGMRWSHIQRGIQRTGFARDAVVLLSTPLYSNTTLVAFVPSIAAGSRIVLMPKFDAGRFLALAASEHATHYALVPVQYRRIMSQPDFESFDLSHSRMKTSTSAPFSSQLKADVLRRWPGGLIDIYGMTEGGAACVLMAHEHPDKLHTVGRPVPGHEIRLIDENGREAPAGCAGEIVGRSPAMMTGYLGQADKTREAEWYDSEGRRFIRHGDIGRIDEDGFLILLDRAKDMIISGGFNIYPSDLEAVLKNHPGVIDAAVIGKPSEQWGETPVGFVVLRNGSYDPAQILSHVNQHLGKTQRLAEIHVVDELPRSAIGKILKRELRDRLQLTCSI